MVLLVDFRYSFRVRWCEHSESFKCSTSHSHSLWFVSICIYIPPFLVQRKRFVDWVNQVLNLHKGTHLDEFSLHFVVNDDHFNSDIDSWISFAFQKGVKRLYLIFICNWALNKRSYTLCLPCFIITDLIRKLNSVCALLRWLEKLLNTFYLLAHFLNPYIYIYIYQCRMWWIAK